MAQTKKTNIRNTILQAARKEFLQRGFKNTSMRAVSRLSGVTLSNIYNYFKDKNELFRAVLSPLLDLFDQMFLQHNSPDYLDIDIFSMDAYQERMINEFMVIPRDFRTELKLLLFNSSGSSLENFRDFFTDRYTEESARYMRTMKARYPHVKADLSRFFLHAMCSFLLTIMGEIVTHNELTDADIKCFITEYVTFSTAGWKAILEG